MLKVDAEFWRKYTKVYDTLNNVISYQELLADVCNELQIKSGDKILEAGCGTGNLAIKMKGLGAEVIGLDSCKEALDVYKQKDKDAKAVLWDLSKTPLPFPDNYFNKITCVNVLYAIAVEKRESIVKEFYRILKPEGKVVLVNVEKNGSVCKIYFHHLNLLFREKGAINMVANLLKFLPNALRLLYYNLFIVVDRIFFFVMNS
ncbi:methyltransferase domain-containing protein [Candidatus Parcubacteria bacterium]|nr:MAG: methyltransferase domain-containing protein [Candidatus Parcubacteria bacterium]